MCYAGQFESAVADRPFTKTCSVVLMVPGHRGQYCMSSLLQWLSCCVSGLVFRMSQVITPSKIRKGNNRPPSTRAFAVSGSILHWPLLVVGSVTGTMWRLIFSKCGEVLTGCSSVWQKSKLYGWFLGIILKWLLSVVVLKKSLCYFEVGCDPARGWVQYSLLYRRLHVLPLDTFLDMVTCMGLHAIKKLRGF